MPIKALRRLRDGSWISSDPDPGSVYGAGPLKLAELAKRTIKNAPWTLIASFGQPVSNYVIMLMLTAHYGLLAAGQFRLLLSIFGVLSIFTLPDAGRVIVRSIVLKTPGVVRPLFLSRVRWGLLGLATGMVTSLVLYQRGDEMALPVLWLALLLPVGKSAEVYAQINQAKMQFPLAAAYSIVKYGSVTGLALACAVNDVRLTYFLLAYFTVLFGFNVYFLVRQSEIFEAEGPEAPRYVNEGFWLSLSGVFPLLLEQADKFIIAYVLGLEALAIYTIGISTGRLLLNFVKPVLSIYFASLVNHRPDRRHLLAALASLTAIGVLAALLLRVYFTHLLPAEYLSAYPLSVIVLSGLGLFFVSTILYYSSVYHKDASIGIPTRANLITFIVTIVFLLASVVPGGQVSLILFAASYPLRDLVMIISTAYLSKASTLHGTTCPLS